MTRSAVGNLPTNFGQQRTRNKIWQFSFELLLHNTVHIQPDLKGFSPNQFPQLSALKKKSPQIPIQLAIGNRG